MSEVTLNGENVDFQGPAPATAIEVSSLLEQFLGQSGLLLERMVVDGEDWAPSEESDSKTYRKIEAFSISREDKVAQIVAELLGQQPVLEKQWGACTHQVLSRPWLVFQNEGLELLGATQPLVQSLSVLVEYANGCDAEWSGELGTASENLNVGLGSLMDAFEAGDCVVFSDVADGKVLAGIREAFRVLKDDVGPSLEKGAQK